MAWATTKDGLNIYFEDKGSGPVLVYVSGYMGIADIWHNQVNDLSDEFRCITMDGRGYGRSSKPETLEAYTISQHTEDIKAVLKAAKINEKVMLITHSIGSQIATAYALESPEMIAGIIYIGGNANGNQFSKLGVTENSLIEGVSTPPKSVEFYKNFGLNDEIAIEASKWPLHSFKGKAHAIFEYNPGEKEYAEIKVPVLIIHGEKDVVSKLFPCATELNYFIPNSKLEVIKEVNHFPQTEAPKKITSLIKKQGEIVFKHK